MTGSLRTCSTAGSRDAWLRRASSASGERGTTIDVSAPPLRVRLDGMATLQEWLADPAGSKLLCEAVGTDESGAPRGILGNDELIAIIGNFPISTLTAFPGVGLERSTVTDVLHRHAALPAP